MFLGFFDLDATLWGLYQARDADGLPSEADSPPTFRIYGEEGIMDNGSGTAAAFDAGTVDGLYKFSKSLGAADGYERGKAYYVRVVGEVSGVARVSDYSFIVT